MIHLNKEDRRYQLIWWRATPNLPIKCYQLNTVTYGTKPAPYLAIRCLKQFAQDHAITYPIGSTVLLRDFFVDDVMTGADNLTMTKEIQAQVTAVLQEGGFKLKNGALIINNC